MDLALNSLRRQPAWLSALALALFAAVVGVLAGQVALTQGAVKGFGALVLGVAALLALRSVWFCYGLLLAIIILLPFAVVPVSDSPLTPTFFELALLVALLALGAVLLVDRRQRLRLPGEQALWVGLVGILSFAFLLGLGRGYSTETLHNFFKFALALAVFPLTIQLVRTMADAQRVLRIVVGLSGLASVAALILYAGGADFTLRVLTRLVPYGYPSFRIVRYIEDDPTKPMRAVGTAVDPNALGGLLMVGFVLAASQLVVRNRQVSWTVAAAIAASSGLALLLTYSRGAWVGAAVGLVVILLFRRPVLLVPGFLLAAGLLLVGAGGGFTERLWLGFTLQDPATKLRLQEYENAWEIIKQHPWFGVGFGDAPSLELQTGVSSIYLTVAEQAGLVGLAAFLVLAGVVLWRTMVELTIRRNQATDDLLLAFGAAFASVLTVGLVDHYFFNITFPHMVATFWLLAGTLVAIIWLRRHPIDEERTL